MSTSYAPAPARPRAQHTMMRAAVFVAPGKIELQEQPIPEIGPTDALVRVTTTTICGTDVHILKGEYPVAPGRIIGHEPVGVIEALGSAVSGRSEEHTSELQSLAYLVCRLLLEKKK